MELTVGAVLEGKVKSITNFGAFVSLPENRTGMVHISEVANAYVSDIRQHLTEGQDVKVMVIGCENGKINLSIKRLEPKPQRENAPRPNNFRSNNGPRQDAGFQKKDEEEDQNEGGYRQNRGGYNQNRGTYGQNRGGYNQNRSPRAPMQPAAPKTADQLFEEKLKAFMSESDTKLSSMRADHRTKSRRR